ncbi:MULTISPECIES: hypothetical protein [Cytobacillus]|uniref:hypothetical protein n=1 Tax=Cytobacillus TaxID=2675230 RepID=UPI0001F447B7|nr:hypothetical protein [Cytobacillus oceanisediminis]EFV75061.1 hypothetical protein HMPREF1013_04706 [Bacillus sp. 2_A_57_CT2]MCM3402819.1 hypothetical protein [Cytobacillus oceanisediminis]
MTIEKAINSAKASLAVEGLFLTPAEEDLIKNRLQENISEEEFKRKALELIFSRNT